ncbi:MAG: hypothetical protein HY465_01760 [Deltaproteobacteria bacterium]|nr:hypothetical protein [Deltaproteobacteria bacterium]
MQGELSALLNDMTVDSVPPSFEASFQHDRTWQERLLQLFQAWPRSEPALVHALSRTLPRESFVYLGNSLPVREWDLAATREDRGWTIATNRGANGIDGQLSTFLGMCTEGRANWAMVGDLTALYDLAAPWVVPQLGDVSFSIVVMNNSGGKIFSRMFDEPLFENRHDVNFASWAGMWNLHYEKWEQIPASLPKTQRTVVELIPDEEETKQFWDHYDRLLV